ncbi:MAG: acyl-CoA thioesterase [FCB group bacterium]|nr:acyl-CoA thioesterase [FCB group bacterium]MBL7029376.1 acyl-CoA thioesterase [Candidatus Neomarinimicrobiota bacterium]MBL7123059.1 acyl-CoA thioesterase [Candidatus Neomarinimicrobiota bacterium]
MKQLIYQAFPVQTYDKIRYGDTDRQGHVNNATIATFLETGRVDILYGVEHPVLAENCSFVLASLKVDYLKEIIWPGTVEIGTGITRVGSSSIHFYQQLFQNDICVAKAETVSVQVLNKTGKSNPLSETAQQTLQKWLLP